MHDETSSLLVNSVVETVEVEKEFLQSCCVPDSPTFQQGMDAGVTSDYFTDANARAMYLKMCAVHNRGGVIDAESLILEIDDRQFRCVGGPAYFAAFTDTFKIPSSTYSLRYVERLVEAHRRRAFDGIFQRLHEGAKVDEVMPYLAAIVEKGGAKKESLKRRLDSCAFDDDKSVPEPVAVLSIAGKCVSTPGNLASIISQAKSGKSALVGAIIAAMFVADAKDADADFYEDGEPDTLGVTAAAPPQGKFILHLDTEQSPHDFDRLVRRAKKRARCDKTPPWLKSYRLAGFSAAELNAALELLVRQLGEGNIHAILLDGSADFVEDVNAPDICNPFVAHLHALAIKCACPIVGVVHENPGAANGKGRGHFGSQLERKAESNIRLEKDADGITTIYADRMRGAPIPKNEGPRFAWSVEHGMHMSTTIKAVSKEDEKRAELRELAEEIFSGRDLLTYKELCELAMSARGRSIRTVERWFTEMKNADIVRNAGGGKWSLPAHPQTPAKPPA